MCCQELLQVSWRAPSATIIPLSRPACCWPQPQPISLGICPQHRKDEYAEIRRKRACGQLGFTTPLCLCSDYENSCGRREDKALVKPKHVQTENSFLCHEGKFECKNEPFLSLSFSLCPLNTLQKWGSRKHLSCTVPYHFPSVCLSPSLSHTHIHPTHLASIFWRTLAQYPILQCCCLVDTWYWDCEEFVSTSLSWGGSNEGITLKPLEDWKSHLMSATSPCLRC